MFTGLVEEIGTVIGLGWDGENLNMEISCTKVLDDLKIGDSIAVDGVCQTVTAVTKNSFKVTAIDETLKLTNFSKYQNGSKVNLERCLKLNDRLGGHLVQGHVDGVGLIKEIEEREGSKEFFIEVPESLSKYLVKKGSVAVSGISLTVTNVQKNIFSVAIIPSTLEMTTLGHLQAGDLVNIEVDMLAKYIEKIHALT